MARTWAIPLESRRITPICRPKKKKEMKMRKRSVNKRVESSNPITDSQLCLAPVCPRKVTTDELAATNP